MKKSKLLWLSSKKPEEEKEKMIDAYLSAGYEIKGFTIDGNFGLYVLLVKDN